MAEITTGEVASVYAELKLATEDAKEALKKFAANASGTEVSVTAKPDDKSLNKFAEAFTGKSAGSKGTRALDTAFKGISSGVGGLMQALKEFGGALGVVGIAFAAVLLIMKGTDTMKDLMESFNSIFNTVQAALAPVIALIGDILIPVFDMLAMILRPVAKILSSLLVPALEAVAWAIDVIMPLFEALAWALDQLSIVIDSIIGWIYDLLGITRRQTSTTGEKLAATNSVLDAWDVSQAQTQKEVADNTRDIADIMGDFDTKMTKIFESIYSVLVWIKDKILTPIWNSIETVAGWVADFFTNLWEGLAKGLKSIWGTVKETSANVFSGFSGEQNAGGFSNIGGRWSDGYQAGDILGTYMDIVAGSIGKGWLWAKGGTLPVFANGGDIGAQIWGMSERGNPEFLFNSGGYDSVINANALQDAVYAALMKANYGKQDIKVSVKEGTPAGPRELVQWILPSLKFSL